MTLSELVAEEVMKWPRLAGGWQTGENTARAFHDWNPDTNIADAMRVFEHTHNRDPILRRDGRLWMCIMDASDRADDTVTKWHDHRSYTVSRRRVDEHDESVCMAIVMCALRACGVSEDRIEQARRKQ